MDTLPAVVALGVMLVLVTAVGVAFLTRQRALAKRIGSFECMLRHLGEGQSWRVGTAQYAAGRLMWWNAISLSPRPAHAWARDELHLVGRTPLAQQDDAGHELFAVDCTHLQEVFQLIMSASAYAGLVSWLESRPSGSRR